MDRGADCYRKGTGVESWVRHGCKIVRLFIGGNGEVKCLHNNMVITSGLSSWPRPVTKVPDVEKKYMNKICNLK